LYRQLGCPLSVILHFLLLLHASGVEQFATSRHFSTISTDFQEEAEAIVVQPQVPYNRRDFVLGLAAFGLNALFVN